MRMIPNETKHKAVNMWLQGSTYREIDRKLGISIGAMSDIVAKERKRVPDLDQLRKINVMVIEGDGNVPDAVRGGLLLDKVNRLGVSLERLEELVKLAARIASEQKKGGSEFVSSAMKLMSLEKETGKDSRAVIRDLQEKQAEIKELEKKHKNMEKRMQREVNELEQEKEKIKAAFEDQGLVWEEGVKTVKKTIDLRVELRRLTEEERAVKPRLKKERGKLDKTIQQVSSLEKREQRVKGEVDKLVRTYRRYMKWYETDAPEMEDDEIALLSSVRRLEKANSQLQKENKELKEEDRQLEVKIGGKKRNIDQIEEAKQVLETEIQERRKRLREVKQKKNGEIQEMQKKVEEIKGRRDEEEEKLRRATREREMFERNLRTIVQTLNSEREELEKTEMKMNELEAGIKERKEKLNELTTIRLPKLPPLPPLPNEDN